MIDQGIIEEFSQVRNMLEKSAERQDNYFLSAFTLLGVGNIFQNDSNFYFGLVLLCISLFLILKIIECRNVVFYNTTYLLTFIESKQNKLLYETRFQKLRKIFWKDKKGIFKKKSYSFFYKFGYYIKNGIICALAILLFIQMSISIFPLQTQIDIVKFLAISLVAILIVIYSILLMNDRFLTKEFLDKWMEIKEEENA